MPLRERPPSSYRDTAPTLTGLEQRRTVRQKTVSDVMTKSVKTIGLQQSVRAAAEQMRQESVNHLVVVHADGKIAGVLSDRDVRAAQPSVLLVKDPAMRERALSLLKVEDIMVANPYTSRPDQPIEEALTAMARRKVGSIPIVDAKGHPVGILTGFDVLELALTLLRERSAL